MVLKRRPRWLFQNVQSAALPALIENASQNVRQQWLATMRESGRAIERRICI